MLKNSLLAALGGAIGTLMRFGIYTIFKSPGFPAATLLINIAGSLLIGMVIGAGIRDSNFETNWKVFLATGICGGFTTFSAFSVENLQLLQQEKYGLSIIYISASVLAGIGASWIGYKMVTN